MPTTAQIEETKALQLSVLGTVYPELDLRVSRAIRELLVNPAAYLAAVQDQKLEELIQDLTLLTLEEDPEAMSDEALDRLLANYFIDRSEGTTAGGTLRLVVPTLSTFVVPADATFSSGSLVYTTEEVYVVAENPVVSNGRALSAYGTGYAASIPVVATATGSEYNVGIGTAFTWDDAAIDVTSVTAAADFTGGSSVETNTELAARIDTSRTTKSFGARPNIEAKMYELDPAINSVETIGAGDIELLRGAENLFGTRITDAVDIYIKKNTYEATLRISGTLVSTTTRKVNATVSRDSFPGHYEIKSVRPAGATQPVEFTTTNVAAATYELDHYVPELTPLDATFTRYQAKTIEIDDLYSDLTGLSAGAELEYDIIVVGLVGLDTLQDTIQLRGQRPITGSYVVRAAVPAFVTVDIEIDNPDNDVIDTDAIANEVADAINSLPIGTRDIKSCLVASAASAAIPASASVKEPVYMTARVLLPDLSQKTYTGTHGVMLPPSMPLGVTPRICAMYCSSSSVSVSVD